MFEDTVSLPCVELPSVGRIWRGTSRLGSLMIPDPRMSGRQGGVQRAGGDAWQLVGGVSLFHPGELVVLRVPCRGVCWEHAPQCRGGTLREVTRPQGLCPPDFARALYKRKLRPLLPGACRLLGLSWG